MYLWGRWWCVVSAWPWTEPREGDHSYLHIRRHDGHRWMYDIITDFLQDGHGCMWHDSEYRFFFADFAFVSVSFRAFLSDKLLTIEEGALQRKFFSVDAGFVTSPLKLPHASILQAAKVLKLLVCCRPSLSLLLLTPNKAEFEKSEVRNGNICPNVKSDTTI